MGFSHWTAIFIAHIMTNVPFILLIISLVLSTAIVTSQKTKRKRAYQVDVYLSYLMLFAVGISSLWQSLTQACFTSLAAGFLGYPSSPFQLPLAAANLGIGLAGIIACQTNHGFRVATTLIATVFFWGTALSRIVTLHAMHQPVILSELGSLFYTHLILPILLIALLRQHKTTAKHLFR